MGVIGAGGRMGRAVCAAVRDSHDLELAATVGRGDSLDRLEGVDVAVDFSLPDVVLDHVEWTLAHGIHTIVGTSGVGSGEHERIARWCEAAPGVGAHVVPNFSIAAVMAMKLATDAVCFFQDVEIVEYAGRHKADAPAGTAAQLAGSLRAARDAASLPTDTPSFPQDTATTRGRLVDGIPVHSLRMAGILSRQDVLLTRDHELLTIHFESLDRAAFMPGVLLAIREIASRPGLTVGLERLLDAVVPSRPDGGRRLR
ncbi:4-hydroxy-tetrahydrodipicolinate reductase [Actinoallomurus sp. NBC_01490]|uniref:4-hydroxy-tetrahydrodipicolinate reductase n=1 Tax=Actinoallomurus sp. NBC_01490 TaxID=2903557 RepID=UPI002E33A182|nr:dihydrodipicolinate reductase C-terminal domain-containing protein [Actinoallomurus sp. NBC_01490]